MSDADIIRVDENGNPINPASAAMVPGGGVRVDASGMPLTNGAVAEQARRRLAAQGITPEQQKAGGGRQSATVGEKFTSGVIDATTGVGEALAGTVGLVADVGSLPYRKMIAAGQAWAKGRGLSGAYEAAGNVPILPVTTVAGEGAEDFRKTLRKTAGLTDTSESASGPVIRTAAMLTTPIPGVRVRPQFGKLTAENAIAFYEKKLAEVADDASKAALEREMRRTAASLAPRAPDVARDLGAMADASARGVRQATAEATRVPRETPAPTAEELALADRAGQAQAQATERVAPARAEAAARNRGIDELTKRAEASIAPPEPLESRVTPGGTEAAPPPETAATGSPASPVSDLRPQMDYGGPGSVPGPSEAFQRAKQAFAPMREFVDGVAPASASQSAGRAAGIIREAKAETTNAATLERYKMRDVVDAFDRQVAKEPREGATISDYERTAKFANEPTPGYSDFYRKTTDESHAIMQQVYGENRVGYVENYVRHAFMFGSEKDAMRGSALLTNEVGSLSASRSPLKARVLDMPLDEALQKMRAAGIDVKPVTTNPELLRQWTVENAKQALAYKTAWDEAKSGGLIQFVKSGERIPDPRNMIKLNDRVAEVFFPSEAGMVKAGQYYADPNVAFIFNNAVSRGLAERRFIGPTFRGLRAINNAYNQFQLGFSAFHLTGTAINAGISDLALGIEQLARGEIGSGAASVGRSAIPGLSFVRDVYKGRQFINDLVAGDADAARILNERLNPAGARLGVDQAYRNAAADNFSRAWRNMIEDKSIGQGFKALGNLPLAIVQKVSSPLMEYAIPRVKIAAFLDLAESQLARLPVDATSEMRQAVLGRAWDSIDNRFGQIVHDNLFWNKVARDLAQISTRSVGWNLGTIRELGGGVVDLSKGQFTPRLLYSFALPIYAGTIGAVYQALHTGTWPTENKDYFYPKNGLRDAQGRADRSTTPTYMKDVYSYGTPEYAEALAQAATGHGQAALDAAYEGGARTMTTLGHKASPLLAMTVDLASNRDFFGDMIRNPEEHASKKLEQDGLYVLGQLRSFSFQQGMQTSRQGGSARQIIEPFMGFPKAPAEMRKDDLELAKEKERRRARNATEMERAKTRHGG